jgi:hypothetical protein
MGVECREIKWELTTDNEEFLQGRVEPLDAAETPFPRSELRLNGIPEGERSEKSRT